MDWNKKKIIDRFVQSVSYHGPSLITLTKGEQGDSKDSAMNFLYPSREGNMGANYFRNKLQVSCPVEKTSEFLEALDGMQQSFDNNKVIPHPSHSEERIQRSTTANDDFHLTIKRFVASKADLLFSMEGKEKLQRGLDYGMHLNQEALDLYAETPPLETLMEVPLHVRRMQLFKCLKEGDIVIGKVTCKRPFGIIVTLTMLEFGCNRDFTDLDIQALCKSSELDSLQISKEYKDPADAYVIGDIIRGVITGVNMEENRVLISLRHSRLPEAHQHLHLGVIDEPDTVFTRLQSNPEGLNYEEHLNKHKGFNNPRNIDTLTDLLGIDTTAPCSLLRCFQRQDCPEGDYAGPLRKQQSAKWSMDTTAKGVEHFKAGNYDAALKYFEHALQIYSENVEALVARGALCANQDKLTAAIKDFRDALAICPSHRNANKYLAATLVEYGIQQEKEGLLTEAVKSFNGALGLDNNQQAAKDHLEKIQRQIKLMDEKKEQTAAKVDKGLKSRFSHVRELILEEQSQTKKKRKRSDRKKKKKVKSLKKKKKKKKKTRSKGGHHSKRSSSSSLSSSESTDNIESSETDSGDSGDEWVEKNTAVQSGAEMGRNQGQHSKRDQQGRDQSQHSKRESQDGCLASPDNRVHKDRKLHRSTSRTERSPDSDGSSGGISKRPRLHRIYGEEIRRRRQSSSSQRVEREKYDDREADWKKGKRVCDVLGDDSSARKQKTSEWKTYEEETEGVIESKRMKSSLMADNRVLSPFNETFLERELKRIREHSHKDSEKHETSSHYSGNKTGNHYSEIRTVEDTRSVELTRNRGDELYVEERLHAKQFKGQSSAAVFLETNSKAVNRDASRIRESSTFLGSHDNLSESVKDKRSFLVSYEDSSDDENS